MFRQVNRAYNRALRQHGISAEQAHVLKVLWEDGAMTIGELQRQLGLSAATLTGAIDRMEQIQLVRRLPVPGDRRAIRIEVDPRTEALRRRIEITLQQTERECWAGLSRDDAKQVRALLRKALQAFTGPRTAAAAAPARG